MHGILPAARECSLVKKEDITHKGEYLVVRVSGISGREMNCYKDKHSTGNC